MAKKSSFFAKLITKVKKGPTAMKKNSSVRAADEKVKLKPLPQSKLKAIREELLKMQEKLVKIVEEKRAKDLETALAAASTGDDADIANQTYEKEMIFGISSSERETIKQIDDALRKIPAKTYGYCERCRKPIPFKRLMVIPYTRYCLACQTLYESRH